jgi:hypothetical protein
LTFVPEKPKLSIIFLLFGINFLFFKASADVLKKFIESRKEERQKKSATEHWLLSLQEDIDTLPTIKKARLKIQIQSLIAETMEMESDIIDYDPVEYHLNENEDFAEF